MTPEQLVQSFAVRELELELITESISENCDSRVNQHILVIGPRGMGKTMLVLRTAEYLKQDELLKKTWYPVVFSEESYEIFSAAEFWLRALFHLAQQENDKKMTQLHRRLKEETDEKRLNELALAGLVNFADKKKKRLLLVVENLDMILDDQISDDDSWVLRHTLSNEPRLMLLGTSTTRFNGIENSNKAMYDLFKIHWLEGLDLEESRQLWERMTGELIEERRIRPIQILTGGNPRLMSIISSFAAGASFRELMQQLTRLIDEYTTYFKSNIESLPPHERRVFVTLANIWEPASAAEVAEEARIPVNKASALLKRLEMRGCVSVLSKASGKKSFQVTERLYNIYHLMRLSGNQSGRVRAVVEFMVNFYEGNALAEKINELILEAYSLNEEDREDHLNAYHEISGYIRTDEESYTHDLYKGAEVIRNPTVTAPGRLERFLAENGSPHLDMFGSDLSQSEKKFATKLVLGFWLSFQEQWQEMFDLLNEIKTFTTKEGRIYNVITDLIILAAAAGFSVRSLEILEQSAWIPHLEPLIAALKMMTGKPYNAPLEVGEVARDVVKQIETKKEEQKRKRSYED